MGAKFTYADKEHICLGKKEVWYRLLLETACKRYDAVALMRGKGKGEDGGTLVPSLKKDWNYISESGVGVGLGYLDEGIRQLREQTRMST